jgi:hypothetical protein
MTTLTPSFTSERLELRPNTTEEDLQVIIRAVYKQVLGNAHLLESQRNQTAESLLRNRDLTVRGFVRAIAQSELYKSLFFDPNSAYRFIELNCKHLLGRAPLDQAEISAHVQICISQGYAAEIDSYLDSAEYLNNFGENCVPYPRSNTTQTGIKNVVFNRTINLLGGAATSDSEHQSKLISSVATNLPQKIKVSSLGQGGAQEKRFRIVVTKGVNSLSKLANKTYCVSYSQLSQNIQNIQKTGGKILSITEMV